jgi:hypothetical protein
MSADSECKVPEERRRNHIFSSWTAKIREINAKYSQPRLKMTPLVKYSLLVLRLYLIFLVVILMYKFYTVVSFR